MFVFFVFCFFVTIASAEKTCSSTLMPMLNDNCPSSFTKIDGQCCRDGDVVDAPQCVDLLNPSTQVSDCPARAYLCNNSAYRDLMRTQCPKTCGYCSNGGNGGGSGSTCLDKINPSTGVSDCPYRTAYCNNAVYRQLMIEQCPRTCGFC